MRIVAWPFMDKSILTHIPAEQLFPTAQISCRNKKYRFRSRGEMHLLTTKYEWTDRIERPDAAENERESIMGKRL